MTINHRAEAERHLSKASFWTGEGPNAVPVNPAAVDFHLRSAQVHATLATANGDLRGALETLASHYEAVVAKAPRHPQYLYINPLKPWQRAEHDRAVAYRNAAHAIRHILRTGDIPQDLVDDSDLEHIDNE
ncbi:hypothetical protein PL81_31205 [Streptomyces sp. RSD-27]|nr:hypothetical protein PL81_31205 [Streptomyces sp. RSD-27]